MTEKISSTPWLTSMPKIAAASTTGRLARNKATAEVLCTAVATVLCWQTRHLRVFVTDASHMLVLQHVPPRASIMPPLLRSPVPRTLVGESCPLPSLRAITSAIVWSSVTSNVRVVGVRTTASLMRP